MSTESIASGVVASGAMEKDALSKSDPSSIEAVHEETIHRLLEGQTSTDRWLIGWSDHMSPILVKETRQALKSRQFRWTFLLVMLAIATWTLFCITMMMPGIYFFPAGKTLLTGYLFLLIVPTVVIVPNAAFHSMASELDQGTFDALTISPLTPLKIVVGKWTVAGVQSLIYFSALAPCIALTYLLRGVPVGTVAVALGVVAVMSLVSSAAGLLLGSINRAGVYSTVLSVIMILFSLFTCLWGYTLLMAWLQNSVIFRMTETTILWVSCHNPFVWVAYDPGCGGGHRSGGGELFDTDSQVDAFTEYRHRTLLHRGRDDFNPNANRFQHIDQEFFFAMLLVIGFHWGMVGTFFIGESGTTSPRAQRSLPDTLVTRLFFTWMNPGSGPGFFFSICSFAGVAAMTVVCHLGRNQATTTPS